MRVRVSNLPRHSDREDLMEAVEIVPQQALSPPCLKAAILRESEGDETCAAKEAESLKDPKRIQAFSWNLRKHTALRQKKPRVR
mmetsp:Transcript_41505/g.109895  ORF Transcript_41505/g.109895 Transcript_41505/m.109895 type:complete len:84 (-) Transcript_41505:267-518(-)